MGAEIPLPRRALSVQEYHRMGAVVPTASDIPLLIEVADTTLASAG